MSSLNYLYCVIFAVELIFSIIISKLVFKSIRTPILFFSVLWCVVGFGSNLCLYGFYSPSSTVNLTISIGIFIFTFFFAIFGLTQDKKRISFVRNNEVDCRINVSLFRLLNAFAILIELIFFAVSLGFLISSGFSFALLRGNVINIFSKLGLLNDIRDYLTKNIITCTSLIAVVYFFCGKNKRFKKETLFIALIENTLFCFSNAARGALVNLIMYILFAAIIFGGNKIKTFFKKYKKILAVFLVAVLFVLFMQFKRTSNSIGETIYIYYFAGPSYMTQLIEDSSIIRIGDTYLYGNGTFGFITNFYHFLSSRLFGINNSAEKLIVSDITVKQYFVGDGYYINAMSTCFYVFLLDFGFYGMVIGPLILSILLFLFFRRTKNNRIFDFCIYVYLLNVLIRTVFKWELIYIDFSFVVLFMFLLCFKSKKHSVALKGELLKA